MGQPKDGDIVYGVDSDGGRRRFLKHWRDRMDVKLYTIDEYEIDGLESANAQIRDPGFKELVATRKANKNVDPTNMNAVVRSKCKVGIQWATSKNKTIHFCLGDLDLDAVVDKNYTGHNPDTPAKDGVAKNRSITGSELRWVYRHRNDASVMKRIQFWEVNLEQTKPPWQADVTTEVRICGARLESKVCSKESWTRYTPRAGETD